jgi:CubicO group peptidase (beta-lactamase class C family)
MNVAPETATTIHGHCDEKFARVQEEFLGNFADGSDVGASFALTVNGEFVVDIWAGYSDEAGTKPWQEDTIVNVYSTTKTMTALCALVLADRGVIDLNAPVARYWPEFAQNGKAAVLVRHLLSHSAGLSGLEKPVSVEDTYNWDFMTGLLAAQAPWWEPGTQSGYHALTQGYLIGEVVRRATGMSLGTFFRREIAEPIGADFHIGLDPRHFERVGELIPPPAGATPAAAGDPDSIAARTFRSPAIDALASRTTAWRRAEIPAANGHGNARSVTKVQTLVANGGRAFGKQILSKQGCDRIFEEQTNGPDLVLGMPQRYGMGYGLTSQFFPLGPNPHTCFWGGWGGSLAIVDADAHVCFAYVMNKMGNGTTGDMRGLGLAIAAFDSLALSQ